MVPRATLNNTERDKVVPRHNVFCILPLAPSHLFAVSSGTPPWIYQMHLVEAEVRQDAQLEESRRLGASMTTLVALEETLDETRANIRQLTERISVLQASLVAASSALDAAAQDDASAKTESEARVQK